MKKWEDEIKNGKTIGSKIKFGRFRLSVHHYSGFDGTWFATCDYIFYNRRLVSEKLPEAKCQAVSMFQEIIDEADEQLIDFL